MECNQEQIQPVVKPIKNGWAAYGNGWAVHAYTPEGAIQKFRDAECRHQEIDKLPFRHEQFRVQQSDKDKHN